MNRGSGAQGADIVHGLRVLRQRFVQSIWRAVGLADEVLEDATGGLVGSHCFEELYL